MKALIPKALRQAVYNRTRWVRYLRARLGAYPTRSFSQHAEDCRAETALGRVQTFVDVGAHDGFNGSNTFRFALQGARGVCIEPVTQQFLRLQSLHRFNPRVQCVQTAISEAAGVADIVVADARSHLAANAPPAPGTRVQRVPLVRLDALLAQLAWSGPIDLLSVDVEGHELAVLRSHDWQRYPVRALILETHYEPTPGHRAWTHTDIAPIEALLADLGFALLAHTPANTLYIKS